MTIRFALLLAGAVTAACLPAGCGGAADTPSTPEVTAVFDRLDHAAVERVRLGNAPGMVVGALLPDGTTTIAAHGLAASGTPMTRTTRFEVGSVTKTFTATLLALESPRVPLDTPVARLLPGWRIPSRDATPVGLEDLATHRAGLPADFASPTATAANPWNGYGEDDLRRDLATTGLASRPGTAYAYSNVGYALLGTALARAAGTPFARLLRDRILVPAGLRATTADAGGPMATGHDGAGRAVPPLDIGAFAPAGTLRSDAADMLRWARMNLAAAQDTELGRAMALAREPRASAGPGMRVGLGWHVLDAPGGAIVWHNGGTPGFRAFLGFSPSRRTAVVVLANGGAAEVDDMALHALDPAIPLAPVAARPRTVALPPARLRRYAGTYRVDDGEVVIEASGGGLRATPAGQPPVTLLAVREDVFLLAETGAEVTFTIDAGGRVTGFTMLGAGVRTEGVRTG